MLIIQDQQPCPFTGLIVTTPGPVNCYGISAVTIENDVTGPLGVYTCNKVSRRLSSTQIVFRSDNGIQKINTCSLTGPNCSNSFQCCLPSPAVSSSHTSSMVTSSSSSIPLIPHPSVTSSLINPATSLPSPLTISTSVPTHACHPQTNTTDRGQFEWPLTLAGVTATILCPNGPNGATASRICSASSDWESPDVMMCATTDVTNGFNELSKV